MDKVENIEGKVNRELIDAEFEGYKLSLEPISSYSATFPKALTQHLPADEQVRHEISIF